MFESIFKAVAMRDLDTISAGYILQATTEPLVWILVPLFLMLMITAILGNTFQVGLVLTPLRFDNLNPANYFKNLFNIRGVVELLKQILKVAILVFVAYKTVTKHWTKILALVNVESLNPVIDVLKLIIKDFTIDSLMALVVVALADILFQRIRFIQEQRMTLKEVIDETKESEGDPFVKAQRRAMARRLNQRRQVMSIADADFIATNPTKLAVAIKYTSGVMSAPKVVAKGGDAFAWTIIGVAKRHGVPVIENVPLARALYKLVKLDQEIPPELYRAVAEVLLFAYQVRGKARFR
jgi:flagellar biosynthetic protein FlhB